jgi:hypothetical protein
MTVSAALKKRMDFSEVTGGPRRAPRPGLGSKARPIRRVLSFRKLLINWLLGQKGRPFIIRDAEKALHLIFLGTLNDLLGVKSRLDPILHDPECSAFSLLPWIRKNNPLFYCKNGDIGPKSGPINTIMSIIGRT